MIEQNLDDCTELGSRSLVEQGGGSLYICLHEIAVLNMELDCGDNLTQHLDAENNRIIIELGDPDE